MAENLAYLPSVNPSSVGSDTTPYYYVFGYEDTNVIDAKVGSIYTGYGVLFNWKAATSACPSGWHLPSDAEWNELAHFLGPTAGGKMKEAGTDHWSGPNNGATNSSGFSAFAGGCRYDFGVFGNLGYLCGFWSSSVLVSANAGNWLLNYNYDYLYRFDGGPSNGYSVRCLRDSVCNEATLVINNYSRSQDAFFSYLYQAIPNTHSHDSNLRANHAPIPPITV
jgi:uncharacterized protein (TIGR02145 family)